MAAPVILAEVRPRRTSDGAAVTVRLAGGGGTLPYRYAGVGWRAGLAGLPTIVASIDFKGNDLGGGGISQAMVLRWAPSSASALSELAAYHWEDAEITVRIGPEGAMPPVLLTGKVLKASSQAGVLEISLADPAADLKKPVLTARFAGTGGLDGPVEWEDRIKPRAWGRVFNVLGDVIDKANNIHCFGDPTRPWQAFDAVRDKGAAAAQLNVLAWQGSTAATFAALQAATAPQGGGIACPSIACVKWWTQPAGALCADIRGEIGAGYVETAPEIAQRVAAVVSAVPFAAGTIAAAAALRPIPVGWLVTDESTTAAQVLDQILGDVSLMWLLGDAEITIRPWAWGASVASARSHEVSRRSTFKPVAKRKLGYRKNWNVMSRDALAGIVLATDVIFDDGVTAEDLKPAAPGATPGAPNGTPIGGVLDPVTGEVVGGKPAEEVIEQIDLIEATAALTAAELDALSATVDAAEAEIAGALNSIDGLDRARIAGEAAARQLDRQVSEGAEALLRTVVEASKTRRRMRDAGIVVDPEDGTVSIRAVDETRERLSLAEIKLVAAEAAISLRATSSWVLEQISIAAIDPSQIAELQDIFARLSLAEVSINGLLATIALKADTAALDEIGLTVTNLGITIDALAETITTKAETTVVTELDARVGAVETVISTLGNMSSITTIIRQARFIAQDTAEATLKGLLAQHAAGKLRRQQIAEVRSDAYAKIDEGLAAEASRLETLAAEVGAATAAIADVDTARVEGDHANATAIDSVAATLAGLESEVAAEVARLDAADVTEAEARAASIQAVEASLGDLSATVTDLVEVVVTAEGASAKALSEMDVNGRVLGFYRTNDGTRTATVFRTDKFGLVDPDTDEQYFGVDDAGAYFRNINIQMFGPGGTAMKVTGIGFGSTNQFIEWFGPTMPLAACTEANGTYWLKLDGSAYFGGTLTAGARKNAQQTTDLAETAQIVVGPFGTAGGLKVVTLSYFYLRERIGPGPGVSGISSATVVLEKLEGGVWVVKATLNVSGSNFTLPPSEPGAFDGQARTEMGGSLTFTDNAAGTLDVSYRGRIVTRTVAEITGASPNPDIQQQTVSVMSIEE